MSPPLRSGLAIKKAGDLLPLPFKGGFLRAPPAQDAFSPLLLLVQGVQHRCRIGCTPRGLKHPHCATFNGKDTDGYRMCVWNKRGATDGTAEHGLLQLLRLFEEADRVECLGYLRQLLLLVSRQDS